MLSCILYNTHNRINPFYYSKILHNISNSNTSSILNTSFNIVRNTTTIINSQQFSIRRGLHSTNSFFLKYGDIKRSGIKVRRGGIKVRSEREINIRYYGSKVNVDKAARINYFKKGGYKTNLDDIQSKSKKTILSNLLHITIRLGKGVGVIALFTIAAVFYVSARIIRKIWNIVINMYNRIITKKRGEKNLSNNVKNKERKNNKWEKVIAGLIQPLMHSSASLHTLRQRALKSLNNNKKALKLIGGTAIIDMESPFASFRNAGRVQDKSIFNPRIQYKRKNYIKGIDSNTVKASSFTPIRSKSGKKAMLECRAKTDRSFVRAAMFSVDPKNELKTLCDKWELNYVALVFPERTFVLYDTCINDPIITTSKGIQDIPEAEVIEEEKK